MFKREKKILIFNLQKKLYSYSHRIHISKYSTKKHEKEKSIFNI